VIALDTNILVRFFTQDDPAQSQKAEEILSSLTAAEPAWVGLVVLMELVGALAHIYEAGKQRTMHVLDHLLTRQELVLEQAETVGEAVRLFRTGKADFDDCLIAASAKAAGCSKTLTFDRVAARDAGMELIA
jgi:predicted nucleic-acid-binding protein